MNDDRGPDRDVPPRFAGRTAIVTGAGSGIGRATAIRLAGDGAHVVAVDVVEERLEVLRADHPELGFSTVVADVGDPSAVAPIVAAAEGRIDALANVAGIQDGFLPPSEVDDETWDRVFAVNVTGPMRLTRAVVPIMAAAGGGAIVNVSSEAALRASTSGTAYAASKHALDGLTLSTAFFHKGQGIRANAVLPGPVATNIEMVMDSEYAAALIGPIIDATMTPMATPEQVAATIAWLLSDDASNVNGVILPCDGGWSAI